jgi:hypothetical protein
MLNTHKGRSSPPGDGARGHLEVFEKAENYGALAKWLDLLEFLMPLPPPPCYPIF